LRLKILQNQILRRTFDCQDYREFDSSGEDGNMSGLNANIDVFTAEIKEKWKDLPPRQQQSITVDGSEADTGDPFDSGIGVKKMLEKSFHRFTQNRHPVAKSPCKSVGMWVMMNAPPMGVGNVSLHPY
jgi:hypothetical protein